MNYILIRVDGIYVFDKDLETYRFIPLKLNSEDIYFITQGILPEKIKQYIKQDDVFLGQRFEGYRYEDDVSRVSKALDKIKDVEYDHETFLDYIKLSISKSITKDAIIMRVVSIIDDLNKIINLMIEKYRELFMFYLPEISQAIEDHEEFIKTILDKNKEDLMKEFKIKRTMGYDGITKKDEEVIKEIAVQINNLIKLRKSLRNYLEKLMEEEAPNLAKVAGPYLGAKLIEMAGGLQELAKLPSSTIQLLGAEKALFRHLTKKTPPPKHGIIFNHPLLQRLPKDKRGDMARTLASKIAIAAKVDAYNKEKNIADQLLKELNERFEELKRGDKTS